MKVASVRDLRNHYNQLLRWVEAGEEILIERRGLPVAMLIPSGNRTSTTVDWSQSSALRRDKSSWKKISARESSQLLEDFRLDR